MEIERKFLVRSVPFSRRAVSGALIRQGYFPLADKRMEVRLRAKSSRYCLTVKAGRGRTRLEEEISLSRKRFETLWPLVRTASVVKRRYGIPYAGHVVELDIYEGRHRGLMTAEVEFRSVREAEAFEPPPWVGREITGNGRYANESLARSGLRRSSKQK